MQEATWLASTHPSRMLNELKVRRPASGARKCRLFAVACCRRIWDLLIDPRSRRAVDALERHAAGSLRVEEMAALADEAQAVPWDHPEVSALNHASEAAAQAVFWEISHRIRRGASHRLRLGATEGTSPLEGFNLITRVAGAAYHAAHARGASLHPGGAGEAWLHAIREEEAAQAALIRELFGNAVRPLDFAPSWRTPQVVDLARGMEGSKDFDGLPALGDALEESGCDRAEILDHCRGPGIHVPGCWVLDDVLGPWIRPIDGE